MPAKKLYTFWCGWEVDDAIPQSHMKKGWPEGMKGWETGFSETFSTWVARVDASDAAEAKRIIRGCYGKSGRRIRMRWDPEKNAHGYRPPPGRFPE
jgi:hypothetical protein